MPPKKKQAAKKKAKKELPSDLDSEIFVDDGFIPASLREEEDEEQKNQKELEEQKRKEEEEAKQRKLQQKREKMKQKKQKKEKEKVIEEKQLANAKKNTPNPRFMETEKLLKQLKPLNLSIFEITSDGNCMFNAISHQLQLRKQKEVSKSELRSLAASYMREHIEELLPFIDYEGPDPQEFFKNLCDKTENTSEWGGEIELQALSKKLEVPITVYSAVSVPRSFGENYSAPNLLLSYHKHYYALGAHYNSVTDVQIQ